MNSPAPTQPLSPSGGEGAQPQIAAFVRAVRAQLDDLSADEVTELTGGLEADLTDALAEEGASPAERYGDPAEYARELRTAAGLPARGEDRQAERRRRLHRVLFGPDWLVQPGRQAYGRGLRALEEQPWWPAARDFLVVLRPVWWVLRAWIAVQVLGQYWGQRGLLAGGVLGVLFLLAAVIASVELGRRASRLNEWQTNLVVVGNVLAALVFLPVAVQSVHTEYYSNNNYSSAPAGLSNGDTQISNVFPYDSEGRPLTGVQLYDQDGSPLTVSEDNRTRSTDSGDQFQMLPGSPAGSAPRWNAFPMQQRRIDPDTGEATGPIQPAELPLTGVPPLLASPTPTVTPSQTPSAAPSASMSAGAGAGPTASEAPSATPTPAATKKK